MAYIGVQPTAGQYRKLDDISAGFNGSTTSFTTSVGGTNVTAGTAQQLIVSVGGVIQEPDSDYTISTNTITFTTAPTSGLDFFAILMGDALNTVTPSDGSVTSVKLAGSLSVGLADGTVSAPSLFFTGDSNCGLYSPSDDQLAVTTNGVERVEWGTNEVVFNDGGVNYDFRVEGDTNANLLFVDASADAVGIGASDPQRPLDVVSNSSAETVTFRGASSNNISTLRFNSNNASTNYASIQSRPAYFEVATAASVPLLLTPGAGTGVGIGTTDIPADTNLAILGNFQTSFYRNVTSGDRGYVLNIGAKTSGGFANGASITGVVESGDSTGYLTFSTRTSGAVTEKARIDSSGRLLVGTSSARANMFNSTATSTLGLEAVAATTGAGRISVVYNDNSPDGSSVIIGKSRASVVGGSTVVQSGDALGTVSWQGADGSELVEAANIRAEVDGTPGANDMPGRLVFSTTADGASSPTERMRITSDGYFKASNNSTYSTASPDYHQFNQNAASQWALGVFNRHASQPFGVTIQYLNATPNGTTNSFLLCGDSTADRLQVRSNGGIANYSANNVNLSDINTKKDISLAAGTWDCLKEWEIVNFRYKDQPDDADLNMGVIAQQVAESCPEVITVFEEAKDDQPEKLGIKEQQMYWMAIKALQEAQVRIEALEADVAQLKGA